MTETPQDDSETPTGALHTLRTGIRHALPGILIAVGAVWIASQIMGRAIPSGQPAPPLQVQQTDGTAFDLAEARGSVVVLDFWAAWCPACREEAPTLSKLHEEFQHDNVRMLGLAVDSRSIPHAERLGFHFPQALASATDLERYQVDLLPTTVVVAPDGTISASFTGQVSEGRLRDAIEEAQRIAPAQVSSR